MAKQVQQEEDPRQALTALQARILAKDAARLRADIEPVKSLTARQLQVFVLLALSWTTDEIADALGVSKKTVDTHRGHAKEKIGFRNNSELTRYAIAFGLIDMGGNVHIPAWLPARAAPVVPAETP